MIEVLQFYVSDFWTWAGVTFGGGIMLNALGAGLRGWRV